MLSPGLMLLPPRPWLFLGCLCASVMGAACWPCYSVPKASQLQFGVFNCSCYAILQCVGLGCSLPPNWMMKPWNVGQITPWKENFDQWETGDERNLGRWVLYSFFSLRNYFEVPQHNTPEIILSNLMGVLGKRLAGFLRTLKYMSAHYRFWGILHYKTYITSHDPEFSKFMGPLDCGMPSLSHNI